MDVIARVEQLMNWMEEAKAVPFSTSVMISRDVFMEELSELQAELPNEVREARLLIAERDEVISAAHREAERIEADAIAHQQRLVGESEVYLEAARQAEDLLGAAASKARTVRMEADDYIDSKLAGFEIALHKTLQTVERGRARLAQRLATDDVDDPPSVVHGDSTDRAAGLYDHEAL